MDLSVYYTKAITDLKSTFRSFGTPCEEFFLSQLTAPLKQKSYLIINAFDFELILVDGWVCVYVCVHFSHIDKIHWEGKYY